LLFSFYFRPSHGSVAKKTKGIQFYSSEEVFKQISLISEEEKEEKEEKEQLEEELRKKKRN
jgi:hypothetical protein